MAYSDFTLADLRQRFGLTVTGGSDLFAAVAEAELPGGLAARLAGLCAAAAVIDSEALPAIINLAGTRAGPMRVRLKRWR